MPTSQAIALLDFIDTSPSPYHAVQTIVKQLAAFNFQLLDEKEPWNIKPGSRYYTIRDGSSIIFFVAGHKPLTETGYKILAAHTDSPGLKVKPKPVNLEPGVLRLGVEVYGGPILATFTDRDLSLAGRISYKTATATIKTRLVHFSQPLLRLPNLAIHMNRKVNEEGLKLDQQTELGLIFSDCLQQQLPATYFQQLLADHCQLNSEQILAWELNIFDTQKGCLWGDKQQFIANSQLDNLASCHAGLQALLTDSVFNSGNIAVCAFFDHEEIGSTSPKGAEGSFLTDTLQRISWAMTNDADGFPRALAHSFMVSADMAHAYQPNFPAAYEPEHKVWVNQGPVIKINANQRYSSECISQAMFMDCCQQTQTPYQQYSHRTNIPCGSTLGPLASAQLGIRTVDVGNPMWAMHSIRESAGVLDHQYMIHVLNYFFAL